MQRRLSRAPGANRGQTAVTVEREPAISLRDCAALGLGLDENPPSEVVQDDLLRRVLETINTGVARPSKRRAASL